MKIPYKARRWLKREKFHAMKSEEQSSYKIFANYFNLLSTSENNRLLTFFFCKIKFNNSLCLFQILKVSRE